LDWMGGLCGISTDYQYLYPLASRLACVCTAWMQVGAHEYRFGLVQRMQVMYIW